MSSNRTEDTNNDLVDFNKLMKLLDEVVKTTNAKSQYVIGLDAPWGSGKTFFLRKWEAHLNAMKPTPVVPVFVNAWENDFLTDPLPCVVAAFSKFSPERALGKSSWGHPQS